MQFTKKFEAQIKKTSNDWDLRHPVDYLWRKAFNIPFGSPQHLEASFIDQQIWYEEQLYVSSLVGTKQPETAKGTGKVSNTQIDRRGLNDDDIEDIISKYTGKDGTKKLEEQIKKQWQKASTEQ